MILGLSLEHEQVGKVGKHTRGGSGSAGKGKGQKGASSGTPHAVRLGWTQRGRKAWACKQEPRQGVWADP